MKSTLLLVLLVCIASFSVATFGGGRGRTALDRYVQKPDRTYSWSLNTTVVGAGYTAYVLNMVSQTWLNEEVTNKPVWSHFLTICVPDNFNRFGKHAFLFIDGGDNPDPAPVPVDPVIAALCVSNDNIVAELKQVPNQPLQFFGDGVDREEDNILALTWRYLIEHPNEPEILARFAMVKSAVKAMDTVQTFARSSLPRNQRALISKFIVAGASKRGWTTWLTGIVDDRVVGIIPMVIPILNMVDNLNHHYRSLGGWTFAFNDYLEFNITHYLNTPLFEPVIRHEDPISYLPRLDMPILVLTTTGDEFFVPDSAQFFMPQLRNRGFRGNGFWRPRVGEVSYSLLPNTNHGMMGAAPVVAELVSTYIWLLKSGRSVPTYEYTLQKSNTTASVTVRTGRIAPAQVTLWAATTISTTRRDFRMFTCPTAACYQPIQWVPTVVGATRRGLYTASVAAPSAGWTGFYLQLTYNFQDGATTRVLNLSTELNVVPDYLPFPPCGSNC